MRVRIVPCLLALLVLAAAGCGSSTTPATPTACLEGTGAYLRALAAAPGEVALGGGTPISECLAKSQDPGELATVGETMVMAATKLNAQGRAEPGGPASVRLGYLLGAAERGAEHTEGIHSELIRRLTVAARYSPHPPLPAAFLRAYREGFEAGRDHG